MKKMTPVERDVIFDCLDDYTVGRGQQYSRQEALDGLAIHFPNLTSAQRSQLVTEHKNQLDQTQAKSRAHI